MPQFPEYMQHCPNCKLLNPEGLTECFHCGCVYSEKDIEYLKRKLKQNKKNSYIYGLIFFSFLLVFLYLLAEYFDLEMFFWVSKD